MQINNSPLATAGYQQAQLAEVKPDNSSLPTDTAVSTTTGTDTVTISPEAKAKLEAEVQTKSNGGGTEEKWPVKT